MCHNKSKDYKIDDKNDYLILDMEDVDWHKPKLSVLLTTNNWLS
jgi:hypothetical protein